MIGRKNFFNIILLVLFVLGVFFLEIRYKVSKEIIVISITAIVGILGYLIMHYLEIERKNREHKIRLYSELVSGIRVFIKAGIDVELKEKFDETYYKSWLFVSTEVYELLIDCLEFYKIWSKEKSEENKSIFNEKLNCLMKAIRNEITIDTEVDFVNYDFRS